MVSSKPAKRFCRKGATAGLSSSATFVSDSALLGKPAVAPCAQSGQPAVISLDRFGHRRDAKLGSAKAAARFFGTGRKSVASVFAIWSFPHACSTSSKNGLGESGWAESSKAG